MQEDQEISVETSGLVTAVDRVPYEDIPTFSTLFATYCSDYPLLQDFYAGNPFEDSAFKSVIDKVTTGKRDLATLAEVLREQNQSWNADETSFASIDALESGSAVAVVTGQQLGILGGPAYTQYKAITAIQLARSLAQKHGRQVVPVFWLAGEDHDYAEVSSVYATPDMLVHHNRADVKGQPVGRVTLTDQMVELINEAGQAYSGGPGADKTVSMLAHSFQAGLKWSDAFATFMHRLFRGSGLIIMSGDDERLKRLGAPLFRQALTDFNQLNELIARTSEKLEQSYHAQLTPRSTNLFYMEDERLPIEPADSGFSIGSEVVSTESLLERTTSKAQAFSANVVTRPLYQDSILPTVAYVAGPGETAYFAQLKTAYEWANISMPIVYPRASISIIDRSINRLMGKEGVSLADLDTDVERMFTRLVKDDMDDAIDDIFGGAEEELASIIGQIAANIGKRDATLRKSALSINSAIGKELGKLKSKFLRSEKQKQETTRSRLARIVEFLYPGGNLQERAVTLAYYMSRYGSDLVSELIENVPLDTSEHNVVTL